MITGVSAIKDEQKRLEVQNIHDVIQMTLDHYLITNDKKTVFNALVELRKKLITYHTPQGSKRNIFSVKLTPVQITKLDLLKKRGFSLSRADIIRTALEFYFEHFSFGDEINHV
jgi:predicted nucleic-acid-binding protein